VNPPANPNAPIGARVSVVGGAGFLGSHLVRRLLDRPEVQRVGVFDNFSSGRLWHLDGNIRDPRLTVVRGDVHDLQALTAALAGFDTLVHLASNPDIARAATEPAIDFDEGTYLTNNVVEAMRVAGVGRIIYASGSGVYGDLGETEVDEDYGPLLPISTYGASKLAGEALISSYCHMFGFQGQAFRFGNIVGPHQTHGVGFDFIRRLIAVPKELMILGDGMQTKSYVHVDDVIDAIFVGTTGSSAPLATYNVATGDYITVIAIARLAAEVLGIDSSTIAFSFTGGDRGWKGDVPVVRLSTRKIRALGWSNLFPARDAMRSSLESLADDVRAGRMDP
jgi:UDP-glucose 4-epimerase